MNRSEEQRQEVPSIVSEVQLGDNITPQLVREHQHQSTHGTLAAGRSVPLSLNCKYYLIPYPWLSKWRTYIISAGSNISSEKPESLAGIIDSIKCEQHSRLIERPVDLDCEHGLISQKSSAVDGLILITEGDWKSLCEEWGGSEENGVSAEVKLIDSENGQSLLIKTCPEICQECLGGEPGANEHSQAGADNPHGIMSEGMSLVGCVATTALQMVAEPSDHIFSQAAHLQTCLCTGSGETQSCDPNCIPTTYIFFQAMTTTIFTICGLILLRMIRGSKFSGWLSVLLFLWTVGFFYAAFAASLPQFRYITMLVDVIAFFTVCLLMLTSCYWKKLLGLFRSPTPPPV